MNVIAPTTDVNRVSELLRRMQNAEHARHRIVMPAEWDTRSMPISVAERIAHGLRLILEGMPVAIEPHELIVGTRTVFARKDPTKTSVLNPHQDLSHDVFPAALTEAEMKIYLWPERSHNVGGYRKVLQLGFGGIRKEAGNRLASEENDDKRDFLRSVCIAFDAATALALRYAALASEMAKTEDTVRRTELESIADICRHVATEPPRNLHEALQLCWFSHLILMVENTCLMSLGRFDQYMEPFWRTCAPEKAQELLRCFLLKMNDQTDCWQGEGNTSNNVMLSGLRPDGRDGTNELTYACLDALEDLRMPEPLFAVRLHRASPAPLVQRATGLVLQGLGQLALYNDDTFVPALQKAGLPPQAARDYALDACQDVLIDGCSKFVCGESYSAFGLTELLMKTLSTLGPETSFEELVAAYKAEFAGRFNALAAQVRKNRTAEHRVPVPFTSGTLADCIQRGLDLSQGGARYRDVGIFIGSPVNAINSLAAIRKVVYEDRAATLAEVQKACATNFEGQEPLRRRLSAAPKWGNDNDEADLIGKDILEAVCHEVQSHRVDAGSSFLSGIHQAHHVTAGHNMGATPDGRLAHEPFPVTLAPANGTDTHGPTAIMRSMTKLDPLIFQWNCALTLTLHPAGLDTQVGKEKFAAMVKTYLALGGPQLQCNVLDATTLRAAQRNPEQYQNLVVRVWGFCARFIDLSPAYQDELIARTAHSM